MINNIQGRQWHLNSGMLVIDSLGNNKKSSPDFSVH